MKKRLNKLPTNYTVALTEQEIVNLSETLSAVRTAGGGTGGVYIGDGQYIGVDNTNNRISFLPDAATKLESVSDKLDKSQYATDSATFLTETEANDEYAPKSITATVNTLTAVSSTWNEVTNKLDKSTYATDSATFLTAHQSLSGYYQKIETSSKEQLSAEFEKYQTVAGMDQYLTEGEAQATYLTKSSADTLYSPLSTTADIDILKANSGDFSQYYKKTDTSSKEELSAEFNLYQTKQGMDNYATDQEVVDLRLDLENLISTKQPKLTFGYNENNAISSINDSALAGQGGTTYSAGQYININANNTISVTGVLALDEYAQYEPVLIGDSNITATSSKEGTHTQWNLSINSTPVVTDTKLVGENSITAHTTNVSGEWAVGLVQSAYEAIDSVGGIATDVGTLKTASSNWNEVSAKLDSSVASTTYQTKADMNDYLTKSEASTTYQPTGNYLVADDISGKLDKSIYANASGNWENTYNVVNQYSAAGTWLTQQSLTNYYQKTETSSNTEITNALNTKVDKPTSTQTGKLVYDGDTSAWVSMPAGTTIMVEGANGISAEYDNVNTYTVGLSASYKEQIEAVSSKLTKASADTLYAPISVTGDVNTLKSSSGDWNKVSAKLDTSAFSTVSGTFLTKSSADNDYAPISITSTINTLTAASAGWNNKVDKPTSLNDKYLVLRTDNAGNVSGWCDFQDQSYSKSEANGTFVATANIDTTTLSGNGTSSSTKLGVKTDVIATKDYVNSSFLPLSGGTVSGLTTISGSDFDNTLEVKRSGQANNYAHIGLNNSRGLSFKAFDDNASNNVQFDILPNNSNSALVKVSHNDSQVGFLIPAVTATTTAGLTNDGILHIILES